MKQLKFVNGLPELILSGKKTVTRRIKDDKNLSVGNIISCCRVDETEFTQARITVVNETTFEKLTEEDKKGHEPFKSDKEMYDTFSKYYKMKVTPKTKVKVVRFKLLI